MNDGADRHMLFCFTRKFLTIEVDVKCFSQIDVMSRFGSGCEVACAFPLFLF